MRLRLCVADETLTWQSLSIRYSQRGLTPAWLISGDRITKMFIGFWELILLVLTAGLAALALAQKQRFAVWVLLAGLLIFGFPFLVVFVQMRFGLEFVFPYYQFWIVGVFVSIAGIIGVITKLVRRIAG